MRFEYVGIDSNGQVQWAYPDSDSHVRLAEIVYRLKELVSTNRTTVNVSEIKEILEDFDVE